MIVRLYDIYCTTLESKLGDYANHFNLMEIKTYFNNFQQRTNESLYDHASEIYQKKGFALLNYKDSFGIFLLKIEYADPYISEIFEEFNLDGKKVFGYLTDYSEYALKYYYTSNKDTALLNFFNEEKRNVDCLFTIKLKKKSLDNENLEDHDRLYYKLFDRLNSNITLEINLRMDIVGDNPLTNKIEFLVGMTCKICLYRQNFDDSLFQDPEFLL